MRRWTEETPRKARIEIIPMIDVMMFLLVFFVLISINVIPALGIKTALPKSSQAQETKAVKNAVITLAKTGEIQLEGALVTLDDLTPRLQAMQKPDQSLNIMINGDEAVPMQRLVDVMDALKDSGFDTISIAAKKKN
ncbi:MAG: biopolymer transporter ExbD [Rhodospirillales bacterium]|nr:biopolymer transporter ExbD [Rhodospirillales bacterium]